MIFQPDLAKLIVEGRKTVTRRRFSENPRSPWFHERCSYSEGQRFAVQPGRGKERIAEAIVFAVFSERLGLMSEQDARREGFHDLHTFRVAWEAINGSFDADEVVHVIEFKLAKSEVGQ